MPHIQAIPFPKAKPKRERARDRLSQLRTIKLPKLTTKSATADFFVLLVKGPKVAGVTFITGSDDLRGAAKFLTSAKYDVSFPDDAPTRLVRRGILDCEPEAPACQFTLMTPDSVHSLH